MELRPEKVLLHSVVHGDGVPLVALHGAGVDHREIAAALETLPTVARCRRIYPDLPGMGQSPAGDLGSNNEVVLRLADFIGQLGLGPVLLLGHSYGAYLAQGVAARRPDLVLGLALICPLAAQPRDVPAHHVVHQENGAHDVLLPGLRKGFNDYFVVRTPATARRYRDHVVPGMELVDERALARIFSHWELDSGSCEAPTLIVAGRSDSTVGYRDALELHRQYPHATLAMVDGAGHALMHERPGLFAGLLADWLDRGFLAAVPKP
ncbi:alpha/beta fold hydrolase [Specibacter sp. NPDC057265]|uniref:alpha/beta fold hydrolase n=1 Tax=Specibacter sp. NPDC057265 TaxID=3346075 RepID=UPI00363F334D